MNPLILGVEFVSGGGDRKLPPKVDALVMTLPDRGQHLTFQPYTIRDDFTYKRPHGFILDGQASTGVTTWRRLFELICQQLQRRDPERFRTVQEHPDFITRRGHPSFSRDPQALRSAGLIGDGIHAEINRSANHICTTIRRLLATFEIPEDRLQLFLREDRDAGRGV